MTSSADGGAAEGLQERVRFLIKQYSGLVKRKKGLEKAITATEQSIRQLIGGARSIGLPISDSPCTLFYRVQTASSTRKIIDPRFMFEAYDTDNYEAMVEIVSKADELMKKGTREQFDTAIQEMVESISEPFLRISIVKGTGGNNATNSKEEETA